MEQRKREVDKYVEKERQERKKSEKKTTKGRERVKSGRKRRK